MVSVLRVLMLDIVLLVLLSEEISGFISFRMEGRYELPWPWRKNNHLAG